MVVAEDVQDSVHEEQRDLTLEVPCMRWGLPSCDRWADHDITEK